MEKLIETAIHQENKPLPITTDSRAKTIRKGAYVAYNKSGTVKLGFIKSIEKNEWKIVRPGIDNKSWWSLKFEVKIINIDTQQISTIKNPNSLIVL